MSLSRRRFLQMMGASAAATAMTPTVLTRVAEAVQASGAWYPVVWLQGQSDTGCSESLLNTLAPNVVDLVTEIVDLKFHQTVMAAQGHLAISVLDDLLASEEKFLLVVEGAVPTAHGGAYSTMGERDGKKVTFLQWVQDLGARAEAVVAFGTCSAFGGIPAAEGNVTGASPVTDVLPEQKVIRLPSCPGRPHHLVGTLAHLKLYGMPELDELRRPKMFFSLTNHDNCERRPFFERGDYAHHFGEHKCMYLLGCKGPITHNDCSQHQWNSRVNWPVRGGSPCVGCAHPLFGGPRGNALYEQLPEIQVPGFAGLEAKADKAAIVLAGAAAAGIAAHAVGRAVTKNKKES
ncbi:MAG: hydrogenase small subunit [Deferrisomatales bacterium]